MENRRYIVWRADTTATLAPLSQILDEFPAVKVLKARDPNSAVVLMNGATEKLLRQEFPDLLMERDVQYRLVSAS